MYLVALVKGADVLQGFEKEGHIGGWGKQGVYYRDESCVHI